MFAVLDGNIKLFRVWLTESYTLLKHLPREMLDENAMASKMSENKDFTVSVPKPLITSYNWDLTMLANDMKTLHKSSLPMHRLPFATRLTLFFAIRLLVIIAVTMFASPALAFLISLLQFIFLPYSFFSAICYGLETSAMLFGGHVLVFPFIKYACDRLLPSSLNLYLPFSPAFQVCFLLADHIICAVCLVQTPQGASEKLSARRIFDSIWYGFLNCKTYFLVLFPLLYLSNLQLPVTALLLDYLLGLSDKIADKIGGYWNLMFYHIHRMEHMNVVYPDAHKFHHYLHDTTAFDGHVFGSGAPEEWLMIIIEYLIALFLCGGAPPCLTWHALKISLMNKWSFHTRMQTDDAYHCNNFHADHHTKHNKNFGDSCPLDMVFDTTYANRELQFGGYRLKRCQDDQHVMLKFTKLN